MPKLTYIGPHDAVEVPAFGLVCARGETIDVPPEAAGRPPALAERLVVNGWPIVLEEGETPPEDAEVEEYVDLGEGMLAQPDNWELAKGLDAYTIGELRAHAAGLGIDLGATKKKAEILAVIRRHEKES